MKNRSIAIFALLWRPIKWVWNILILGIIIGVLGSIVYTYITAGSITFVDLHTLSVIVLIRSYPYYVAFLLVPIIALTVSSYLAYRHQQKILRQDPKDLDLAPSNSSDRTWMIKRVRSIWITNVLEKSLYGFAPFEIGLQEQPTFVENPWSHSVQEIDRPIHSLLSSTGITQIYDDAGGELLILGEPGSGKTTLLLELARELLNRALKDTTQPIPVVFNLSSWVLRRQSIADWLVEELKIKYQVPRQLAQLWVNGNKVLLLLDGLDEVAREYRSICVDAINSYRKVHGPVSIVICSRSTEYHEQAQTERLLLHNAIVLQPLTSQQIDDFLATEGNQLEAVRKALREDVALKELTATPLMLSVLTLAYLDKPVEELLKSSSPEERRNQVFATCVQSMFVRRSSETRYTQRQTIHWLSGLARQLARNSQTEFYIERLQPDWPPDNRTRQLYFELTAMLIIGLLGGVAGGLLGGLLGAILTRLGETGPSPSRLIGRLVLRLADKVLIGPGGGLESEIKPAEILTWSWEGILKRMTATLWSRSVLPISVLAALAIGFSVGLHNGLYIAGLFVMLAWIALIGLYVTLQSGLSSSNLDPHSRVKFNEGIWRSARNGLLLALGVWLFGGLIIGIIVTWVVDPIVGIVGGLCAGLLAGIAGWIWGGGAACIKHIILRLLLWHAKSMPLDYSRFLNYATERILLQKIGGGYILIHRLLQDYFISLDVLPLQLKDAEQEQRAYPTVI